MRRQIKIWLILALATRYIFNSCAAAVLGGSDGSDGAFNPTTNVVVSMSDHTNGIYQYLSVNIPVGVTVTFLRNANNSPVMWLVQSNCVIQGVIDVSGHAPSPVGSGGLGGPGGFDGGNGGVSPSAGNGPGGGGIGGNASFGTLGGVNNGTNSGVMYGNDFLLPIVAGSGGGGISGQVAGGGGGGGAILIAASGQIQIDGTVNADGGSGDPFFPGLRGGGGSGGAIRMIATKVVGSGAINVYGGVGGGMGRVRIDSPDFEFAGFVNGTFTRGYQPIIFPTTNQTTQLLIASVAGMQVSPSPTGVVSTPDAVIPATQSTPMPVVVQCYNLPLNTAITVTVRPAVGSPVSAVCTNNAGTLTSSTATAMLSIPRGGGTIWATAVSGN